MKAETNIGYDRAWLALMGACLCMFCGVPSVIYFTFGVFLPEIISDTQWSRTAIAAAIGPGALIASVLDPIYGKIVDKYGVRIVVLIGAPIFALSLALLGLFPRSALEFAVCITVMWVLVFAGSTIPYAQMLTGWFDKRRGLALGIMFCSMALGIAAWPPFAAYLIAEIGWRHAYLVMGIIAGSVMFLSALLFLKNAPKRVLVEDGQEQYLGMSLGGTLRTLRFWKMAALFALLVAVLAGMALNFPVIMRQQGADAQTAAAIMSVIGISMAVGRLLLGPMLDRWFAPRIAMATMTLPILALVLMMASTERLLTTVAAALLGLGLSTVYPLGAYMVSRAFGFRAYGTIYALMTIALSLGAASGPAAIGVALAIEIDTSTILLSCIAMLGAAILILSTLKVEDLPYGGSILSRGGFDGREGDDRSPYRIRQVTGSYQTSN